jgi:pimeloyl-ACP methyl ester carboxylesterase
MKRTIDGISIGYDDTGGEGTPVVLLHGYPLDRTMWDDIMPALQSAGARVVRIDLRGCGESAPSTGPALMEHLAGDVAGLLDALGIERAAFVGHSIGGYVLFAFFRMYTERVSGIALVATHVAADASDSPAQRELAAARAGMADAMERDDTMKATVDSYLPRYLAPSAYAAKPELVERLRAIMERQNPRGCAQLQRGMAVRVASDDLLEDVAVPALVIAGNEDAYLSATTLEGIAGAMSGAAFVALDDVGHLPPWEATSATADALVSWLDRVR